MSQNEKKNAYARDYYKKNADKINARRRELYKSKKVKENNSEIESKTIDSKTSPSQCIQLTPSVPYSVPYSFMYVVLTTLCVKSQVNLIPKLW